jgi:FixJ family two-component response regulator
MNCGTAIPKYYGRAVAGVVFSCYGIVMIDRNENELSAGVVSVVDDDESVRESLPDLLRELGFAARAFSSAKEFLASDGLGQTPCLILDIAMPGMTGPDLQRELKRRGLEIPIVFITAHRDETVRTRMLQHGAVECLFKPFSESALVEALEAAFRVRRSIDSR